MFKSEFTLYLRLTPVGKTFLKQNYGFKAKTFTPISFWQ